VRKTLVVFVVERLSLGSRARRLLDGEPGVVERAVETAMLVSDDVSGLVEERLRRRWKSGKIERVAEVTLEGASNSSGRSKRS